MHALEFDLVLKKLLWKIGWEQVPKCEYGLWIIYNLYIMLYHIIFSISI